MFYPFNCNKEGISLSSGLGMHLNARTQHAHTHTHSGCTGKSNTDGNVELYFFYSCSLEFRPYRLDGRLGDRGCVNESGEDKRSSRG